MLMSRLLLILGLMMSRLLILGLLLRLLLRFHQHALFV
jgi:hypothetical protein